MNRLNLGLRVVAATAAMSAGLLATTAAPASAAPFANGSFEARPIVGSFEVRGPGDTLGGGWIVQPGGTVDLVKGYWTDHADGLQSIDLDGDRARGKICQTFDTGAGQDVSIRFSMSRNFNDFSRRGMNSLLATVNGAPLGDDGVFTHDLPVSQIEMNWVEHVESFTGSGSDTVCFESLSQADQAQQGTGPALDHVVLNSPPEVEIATPANDSTYFQGEQALTSFTCSDPDGTGPPSGIVSCLDDDGNPSSSPIDTSTVGVFEINTTATDGAGDTDTDSARYRVVPLDVSCRARTAVLLGSPIGNANPPATPCVPSTPQPIDVQSSITTPNALLKVLVATLRAKAVVASTNVTPASTGTPATVSAVAALASLEIGHPLLGLSVRAAGLHAEATARVDGTCDAPSVLAGSSTIATLTVNGVARPIGSAPSTIDLGIGKLHLNQQAVVDGTLTQRTLFLDLPGTILDVIVGEVTVGTRCNASAIPFPT